MTITKPEFYRYVYWPVGYRDADPNDPRQVLVHQESARCGGLDVDAWNVSLIPRLMVESIVWEEGKIWPCRTCMSHFWPLNAKPALGVVTV